MKEINFTDLINRRGKWEYSHSWELKENEKYFVRYTKDFFNYNVTTGVTIEALGGVNHPDCYRVVKDFNSFMKKLMNMSINEQQSYLKSMWGKQFLWSNEFTHGIVVKLTEPDDVNDFTYHVLIECSNKCTGFKYTQWIPSDSYSYMAVAEVLKNGNATT